MTWTQEQLVRGLNILLTRPGWNITRAAAATGASYFTIINWKDQRTKVSNAYMRPLAALLETEDVFSEL